MLGACAIAESAASRRRAHSTVARSNAAFLATFVANSSPTLSSAIFAPAIAELALVARPATVRSVVLEKLECST